MGLFSVLGGILGTAIGGPIGGIIGTGLGSGGDSLANDALGIGGSRGSSGGGSSATPYKDNSALLSTNSGLMSPTSVERPEDEIKVAPVANVGPNPWTLQENVASWFPQEDDD